MVRSCPLVSRAVIETSYSGVLPSRELPGAMSNSVDPVWRWQGNLQSDPPGQGIGSGKEPFTPFRLSCTHPIAGAEQPQSLIACPSGEWTTQLTSTAPPWIRTHPPAKSALDSRTQDSAATRILILIGDAKLGTGFGRVKLRKEKP